MKSMWQAALIGSLSVIVVCMLDYFLAIYAEHEPVQPEAKISEFVLELEQRFQESWKE